MKKIKAATDCVLCLLPFEKAFYDAEGHPARFVGHPLADQIGLENPSAPARQRLALRSDVPVLAVLPGSRRGEVVRLGPVFARTVALVAKRHPSLEIVAPMATPALSALFAAQLAEHAPGVEVALIQGEAQLAMTAADSVLLASGTAVLEALLIGRPHVVAYRVAPATARLVRALGLLHTRYFSLTNLLAGRELVPEYVQEAATPEALSAALSQQLLDPGSTSELAGEFRRIHESLKRGASDQAADAIISLVRQS